MLDGHLEDIRKMSEEQFVEAFEVLREETSDWSGFKPEFITEDSRYLFVLRCALGLTQREFSEIRGVRESHIGRIESGRKKIIHLKPAQRWVTKIEAVLAQRKPELDTAKARFIEFRKFCGFMPSEKRVIPITRLTKEELLELFTKAKEITEDFTCFKPETLMKFPQSMLIFRLIKQFAQKNFAGQLEMHPRTLISIESGRDPIGIDKALELSDKLESMFMGHEKITFEAVESHFERIKTISRIASQVEEEIKSSLESHGIKFDLHPIIQGLKRKLCVDFAIPSQISPQFIIEAFIVTPKRSPDLVIKKVDVVDHRFHMIKLKEPQIKSILCIKFLDRTISIERLRKRIERELLSTDLLLISDEIQKLPEIAKEMSHPPS